MAKAKIYKLHEHPRPAFDWRALLTQIAFGLALALVAGRCMLLETVRDPFQVLPGGNSVPRGPGADTSLALDLLCCVPALLILARRVFDRAYTLRFTWSLGIIFTLCAWMALSITWADDKFATLVSSSNFIAAIALLWAASQLVRSWTRLRMVAAIAYGLLLAFLAKGFYYKFVEMPSLIEQQMNLLQQSGINPTSFGGRQFIQKMSEVMGFNASANSFAGLIVLLMTIGAGVAIQRIKDKDDPAHSVVLAIFAPFAIWLLYYTQSKAALGMPVLAVVILLIIWRFHRRLARRHTRNLWIGAGVVALAILAVIGHGIYWHKLPTDSLNFRWRYWVASAKMFRREPVHGFGWDNFGQHYLRDRLLVASEEIRDPHNFIIRFFVELGAIGGILLSAWLLRLWWELTRGITPAPRLSPRAFAPGLRELGFIGLICASAVGINIICDIDFTQNGSYIAIELVKRMLYLCALLLGAMIVAIHSIEKPQIDDRPAPWILYGLLTAIGVFLIHNLIEFSIFEPGPCCLFGLLVGATLGVRLENPPVRKPHVSKVAVASFAIALGLFGAALVGLVIPTFISESDARQGDESLRLAHLNNFDDPKFEAASAEYFNAYEEMPLNADYAFRAGRALQVAVGPREILKDLTQISNAGKISSRVTGFYDAAIDHNPSAIMPLRFRAIFALQTKNPEQMIADFEKIMQLNPNEVSLRLEYARYLAAFHRNSEALEQFQKSLDYNDGLDAAEPKRLSKADLDQIHHEMDSLSGK